MKYPTFYRTIKVDGLLIFYREAGPKDAPTILLLHGLPSSSQMFEPLFARLSDGYHLVAPDYPGFGHSDWPDPKKFAYTFDHIAEIMNHFAVELGLSRYTLYMQDYGGAVGYKLRLMRPPLPATVVQQITSRRHGAVPTMTQEKKRGNCNHQKDRLRDDAPALVRATQFFHAGWRSDARIPARALECPRHVPAAAAKTGGSHSDDGTDRRERRLFLPAVPAAGWPPR
jgi:pimeloyl-ACP methyl ester carboxylesterase